MLLSLLPLPSAPTPSEATPVGPPSEPQKRERTGRVASYTPVRLGPGGSPDVVVPAPENPRRQCPSQEARSVRCLWSHLINPLGQPLKGDHYTSNGDRRKALRPNSDQKHWVVLGPGKEARREGKGGHLSSLTGHRPPVLSGAGADARGPSLRLSHTQWAILC